MNDRELLRAYADTGSEAAFSDLVSRHIDWVYGVCRRRVGDPALAEDVTQAVFIVLAKKAGQLTEEVVLAGWLMNAIRFAAADALKRQARRREHERKAAAMKTTESSVPAANENWSDLAPQVDDALNQLPSVYRDAIALRFYCDHTYAEIAVVLGVNEAAAKKRVSRGIDKLRSLLHGKAGVFTLASLTAALAAAAPSGLHAQVVSAATVGQAGAALAIAQGTLRLLELAKLKIAVPVAVAAFGISAVTILVCNFSSESGTTAAVASNLAPAVANGPESVTNLQLPEPRPRWPELDPSLLRFAGAGGAFDQFHLSIPIQALPEREITPAVVVVERNRESGFLLVNAAREALPYAYISGDLLVQLDDESPGGLLVTRGVAPEMILRAHEDASALTSVSVAAASQKQIDIDLGTLLSRLQDDHAKINRDDLNVLRFHSPKAGGRFVLADQLAAGMPPICSFSVTEYVRLAVQIRQIKVGENSPTLPLLTLESIEDLGLSVRQIAAPRRNRDLLPPAGIFKHQAHRTTATRLQSLLERHDRAPPTGRQLASVE